MPQNRFYIKSIIVIYVIINVLVVYNFALANEFKTSYQGVLVDNDGNPINGIKTMTFSIGSWSESQEVTITEGLYSVILGTITPIPLEVVDNDEMNLKIIIDGEILEPIIEILPVPNSVKAMKAEDSEKLDGKEAGYYLKWENLTNIPDDFSDGVDDTGITSENDPLFSTSPAKKISIDNINNWNSTYSWGNHAEAGYLTKVEPEQDPVYANSPASNLKEDEVISIKSASKYLIKSSGINGQVWKSDGNNEGYWANDTNGDITGVIAGNGLTGGSSSGEATLNIGAGTGISVSNDAISLNTSFTDGRYINIGQNDSITSSMIKDGEIKASDIASGVIPNTSDLVTISSHQTISGQKTFNSYVHFYETTQFGNSSESGNIYIYSDSDSSMTFKTKSGSTIGEIGIDQTYDNKKNWVFDPGSAVDRIRFDDDVYIGWPRSTSGGWVGRGELTVANEIHAYDYINLYTRNNSGSETATFTGRIFGSGSGLSIWPDNPENDGTNIRGLVAARNKNDVYLRLGFDSSPSLTFKKGYYSNRDVDIVMGYGSYQGRGTLKVEGNFEVTGQKNFVTKHPNDKNKEIVYVCLEGGEAGTYYRGNAKLENGRATVNLPEHFSLVTNTNGLTAQVTPRGDCKGLFVEEISAHTLIVKECGGGTSNVSFDFFVNGIRKGYENHKVIRDKNKPEDE